MKKRDILKGFMLSSGLYGLISAAVLMMPFAGLFPPNVSGPWSIAAGLLFWAGILTGSISYLLLYRKSKETVKQQQPEEKKLPYGLRFFSNRAAKAVDAVLIVSLAVNVICIVGDPGPLIGWTALFFFITSIYLHFLLNGRIFHYIINNRTKRGKDYEGNEKRN